MKICSDLDKEIATLKVALKEKKQQLLELAEQKKKKQTGDDSSLEVAYASQEAKSVVLEGELEVMGQKADVDGKQTSCVCEGIVELQHSSEHHIQVVYPQREHLVGRKQHVVQGTQCT